MDTAGMHPTGAAYHTPLSHQAGTGASPVAAGGLTHSREPGVGPGYASKTDGMAPMDAGTHPHNSWAGTRDPGRGTSGMVGTGGYTAEGKETVGHKIKKAIPGQRVALSMDEAPGMPVVQGGDGGMLQAAMLG